MNPQRFSFNGEKFLENCQISRKLEKEIWRKFLVVRSNLAPSTSINSCVPGKMDLKTHVVFGCASLEEEGKILPQFARKEKPNRASELAGALRVKISSSCPLLGEDIKILEGSYCKQHNNIVDSLFS